MDDFGTWLKDRMAEKSVDQATLARGIHVDGSAVNRWINKGIKPRPVQCEAIATFLGLDYRDVMRAAGHPVPGYEPPVLAPKPLSEELEQMAARVRELERRQAADQVAMTETATVRRHDARRFRLVGSAAADPSSGVSLSDDEPDGARFFLEVEGDCLAPEINIGDVLMMSASKEPRPGDVVGVVVDGERHVKRVTKKNGGLILDSKRGRLILPMDGASVEGVMVGMYEKK